jgi:hypothetical protein
LICAQIDLILRVAVSFRAQELGMPPEPLDFAASRFRDKGTPFLSARRVADRLGVTLTEMAALAGVARNTLTARAGARKVDLALSPIVRILAMASEMAGDDQRAAIWFKHQPIPGWAGKTAYDLVRERKADKVLAYLEAVRSGVYA